MKIVLFDIDGTLIRTGGAGTRAMNRAFEDVFGVAGAFEGIPMAGRTDRGILHDGASRCGVELTAADVQRFRERYVSRLEDALLEPSNGHGVLPGVRAILEDIALRPDLFPALLTGNCEEGARVKLQHYALWRFFPCGAFGDEAIDRNDLFAVALTQALACGAPPVRPPNVIVVGDTVMDVACARAAGARSIAVATGPTDVDTLRASGADIAFADLSDTAAFMRVL